MSNSDRSERKETKFALVGLGTVVACCAGLTILATLGFGSVVATLTSPWVLAPTLVAVVGIVMWYERRRAGRGTQHLSTIQRSGGR